MLARNSARELTARRWPRYQPDRGTEQRDILALNEKYDKFILVLNVGGMVDLSPVSAVKNILLLSQLGTPTGDVLADILLGKSYPSES